MVVLNTWDSLSQRRVSHRCVALYFGVILQSNRSGKGMDPGPLTDKILGLARRGKLEDLKPLLDAEPALLKAPAGPGHGRTLLWEAVRHGHEELVDELLQRGTDVDAPGRNRAEDLVMLSPLCVATARNREGIAARLVEKDASLSLYDTAWLGDEITVRKAVGEDPFCIDRPHPSDLVWDVTPLHYAIAGDQANIARYLCEQGAQILEQELFLDFAARRGSQEFLQLLFDHGARPSKTNVFSVLSGGNLELISWLSKQGLDVNEPVHGYPPIIYCSRGDKGEHPEWAEALLNCGVDVNVQDKNGRTALHVAARGGSFALVEYLLSRGADSAINDKKGKTPLNFAPSKHRPRLEEIFDL